MDTWQFYQNEEADWCWKHVAGTGVRSLGETSFSSRTDCIADAMRHGYLARTTDAPANAGLGVAHAWGK